MSRCDIGLVGLAVMGQSLARNMADKGFSVAVYNRTQAVTDEFMTAYGTDGNFTACQTLEEMVASLERPRKIFLMVKAGGAVDAVLESLSTMLDQGDVVMDGGNSMFMDTERRIREMDASTIRFLGVGVSGGEEGALKGPSIMPGGDAEAWELVEPILTAISARHEDEPCVAYMGAGGAGHFVKMVHNGIEYGDMQLIAETYDYMHRSMGLDVLRIAEIFAEWNTGALQSYLIEITAEVLRRMDDDGQPLIYKILDSAGQKGTGRWTTQTALDVGASIPTITAAVDARILSSNVDQRHRAANMLEGPDIRSDEDMEAAIADLRDALYTAKLCSYAQGFAMLSMADEEYGFGLDHASIARIWRQGCIIRAVFLDEVAEAFEHEQGLDNLLLSKHFGKIISTGQDALRRCVIRSLKSGIPAPAMGASLAYYDSLRSRRTPAALIQAQRDYFGAHTYQRVDRDGIFHTEWI